MATRCAASTGRSGLRFNEAKFLLDPYAKAVTGKFRNRPTYCWPMIPSQAPRNGYPTPETRDNTTIVPKAIIIDDNFDWQDVAAPVLALEQLVIFLPIDCPRA
jgi:glycogen operon protein